MRVYDEVIVESGAAWVFLDRLGQTDAQHWALDEISDLDEASEVEDPEAELRKERDTTQAFVQAAKDALAAEGMRRDLERKSMQLEDLRSRLLQSQ